MSQRRLLVCHDLPQSRAKVESLLKKRYAMKEQIVCKFSFVCDQKWDDLRNIEGNIQARFCEVCESPVYLTETYEELATNVAAKRCVAIRSFSPFGDDTEFIGDVVPVSRNSSGIDPILGRSLEELELASQIEQKLSACSVGLIGDLIQLSEADVARRGGLTSAEVGEVKEMLASRGLTLGMFVENWGEYLERRKQKMR